MASDSPDEHAVPVSMPYFAYGSNLCQEALEKELGDQVAVLGPATLRNHRLAFTRASTNRNGGVADILPARGFTVRGVLYRLSESSWSALDAKEGTEKAAYRRVSVSLERPDGTTVEAIAYEVVDRSPTELTPSADYIDLLVRGARSHALEPHYIDFLKWIREQAVSGHFGEGLLARESRSPRGYHGESIAQINPCDSPLAASRGHVCLQFRGRMAPVDVTPDASITVGEIGVDQSIREGFGIRFDDHYGYRARLSRLRGRWPWTFGLRLRRLHLRVWKPSWLDCEKSLCVLHPSHMSMIGVRTGDYVRIRAVRRSARGEYELRSMALQCTEGTRTRIRRLDSELDYPRIGEVYLDQESRAALGNIECEDLVVVSAAVGDRAMSRVLLYGASFFLAILSLLPVFDRFLGENLGSVWIALAVAASGTILFSYLDLRRMRPS